MKKMLVLTGAATILAASLLAAPAVTPVFEQVKQEKIAQAKKQRQANFDRSRRNAIANQAAAKGMRTKRDSRVPAKTPVADKK